MAKDIFQVYTPKSVTSLLHIKKLFTDSNRCSADRLVPHDFRRAQSVRSEW